MKRTYVDVIGEYYDKQYDLLEDALQLGINQNQYRRLFRTKLTKQKRKIKE